MSPTRSFLAICAVTALTLAALALAAAPCHAYPPGVGILSQSRSCTSCHASNGPWTDETATVVDILDATTRKSLRQPNGVFVLQVTRGQPATVVTIIGRSKGDAAPKPLRNSWLYVDPTTIKSSALSKFAPGWDVNLPMSCRIVGDNVSEYPGAALTALPMTVRPGDAARDAEVQLQVMLTSGESSKGNPDAWLKSNYLERWLHLKVLEPKKATP